MATVTGRTVLTVEVKEDALMDTLGVQPGAAWFKGGHLTDVSYTPGLGFVTFTFESREEPMPWA